MRELLNGHHLKYLLAGAALMGLSLVVTPASWAADHRTYGIWRSGEIGGGGYLQHVVISPSDVQRVYLTSDVGGLFRSDDGGRTWRMLHGGLPADPASYSVRGLVVSPTRADRIVGAFGNGDTKHAGIHVSDDGGKTWRHTLKARFEGNGESRADGFVLAMDAKDEKTLWTAPVGDGIFRSSDGGETWVKISMPLMTPSDLILDHSDSQRLWLVLAANKKQAQGGQAMAQPGMMLTEDGGKSWRRIGNEAVREVVQDKNDPATLYGLFWQKQIQRSRDRGLTWEPCNSGLPPYPVKDTSRGDGNFGAITAVTGAVIIGSNGGEFYVMKHGADHWEKILRQSVDEGAWWGSMKLPTYRHYASAMGFVGVDPRHPSHWAFTDWYALYQSWDAGKNWKLTIDGVEMTVVHTVVQDPRAADTVHVGLADVGYFRSRDGGAKFSQCVNGISNNIKCIAVCPSLPQRLYAVGPQRWEWQANQVFISDDGGTAWRRSKMKGLPDMETHRCNTVVVHPLHPDEVYIAVNDRIGPGRGGVWKSTDGGNAWTWLGLGLPDDQALFRTDIWVAGPELAISNNGSLLASSHTRNRLFRYDPAVARWHEVKVPFAQGGMNAVLADPSTTGTFYLAAKNGGLWKSADSGHSWIQLSTRDAWSIAVDTNNPKRLALTGAEGIYVSLDAGKVFRRIDQDLPYRQARNVLCFAGDRLVVGTGGNGVFHANLPQSPNARIEKTLPMAWLAPVPSDNELGGFPLPSL